MKMDSFHKGLEYMFIISLTVSYFKKIDKTERLSHPFIK